MASTRKLFRPVRPLSSRFYTTEKNEDTFLHRLAKRFERYNPPGDSHAKLLTSQRHIYEMQVHNIRPDKLDEYMKIAEETLPKVHDEASLPVQLLGSWYTIIGPQDQAVHIWFYENGWDDVTFTHNKLHHDREWRDYVMHLRSLLRSRKSQMLMEFSFWGKPQPRKPGGIYELRSYSLKPGTLLSWGNEWQRGIKFRSEEKEAVGGWFSQIGKLYQVHHMWAYENLTRRKEIRENAWMRPGWEDVWAHTVPLVESMKSKVLLPASFSPLN
ncbi:protein NipSnap homolog 2-like [Oscarella lobularis]|uniref:protein NipSnap homolog 2-like n=1 Tax=Oscarella lobularis TaxID=121494 RepID=UPI00331361EA